MSQEDNYPPGMQHQNDQNGIESSIDQIFEGIISLSIIRVWFVWLLVTFDSHFCEIAQANEFTYNYLNSATFELVIILIGV